MVGDPKRQRARKLFVEGGGDRDDLKTECRKGFSKLLKRARIGGSMPRIVACGGRGAAYARFVHAMANKRAEDEVYLLVDSEESVVHEDPWNHVAARTGDGWSSPGGAAEFHLHFMVQVMETWFLADPEAVEEFFGKGFSRGVLPKHRDIEAVSKADIYRALHEATKHTQAGPYGKGQHSFQILGELDPEKIANASVWAKRFFQALAEGS
jgi:Domain of unknown function (DUF4276)